MPLNRTGVDYALIFNASSNGMAFTELDSGRIVDVNEAWVEATGIAREDALGHTALELGIWADAQTRSACMTELHRTGRVVNFAADFVLKSAIVEHSIAARIFSAEGARYALWEFRDMAALRRAQEASRASQVRLASIQEGAHIGIWEWDVVTGRSYWSPQCERLYGFTPGTLRENAQWRAHVHPDDLRLIDAQWEANIAHGRPFEVEFRFRRDSGETLWILTKGRADYDAAGTPMRLSGINLDITERKLAEQALRRSERLLRDSQAAARIGSYINHLEAGTYECTPILDEIFGITADYPHTNEGWVKLMHPDFMQSMGEALRQSIRERKQFNAEYMIIRPSDGARRWMHGLGQIAYDEGGKAVSLIGTVQDITERKHAEQALQRAKEAADAASRAKSEFLANMSHEIRTPLNGLIGNLQLLEMTALDSEQKDYLASMAVSGNNLLALIGDILDLSKIEADRLDLEQTGFSLRGCVDSVILTQRMRIAGKALALRLDIQKDVPDDLIGDSLRVKQILLNLVGNAIKFTEKGSIAVSAALRERQGDAVLLELVVADTGIGMSESVVRNLFKPFVQADSSTARLHGGAGLGLAICRRLAERMGGSISVESAPGAGSAFRVQLPFRLPPAGGGERTSHETAARKFWSGPALQVLLVEDDQINQQVGTAMLRKLGHRVTVAASGKEAIALLAGASFDLVLMDIQMPAMNGEEALAVLREREQTRNSARLPVIALTAHALESDRDRYRAQGFDGYVAKPLDAKTLVAEMRRVLKLQAAAGTGEAVQSMPSDRQLNPG